MPEDKQAQMEALARRKPRRIIQSQLLIQILWIVGGFIAPMVTVYWCFIFFFVLFPYAIRWFLSLWFGGVVLYVIYDVWLVLQMRSHKRSVSTEKTLKRRGDVY